MAQTVHFGFGDRFRRRQYFLFLTVIFFGAMIGAIAACGFLPLSEDASDLLLPLLRRMQQHPFRAALLAVPIFPALLVLSDMLFDHPVVYYLLFLSKALLLSYTTCCFFASGSRRLFLVFALAIGLHNLLPLPASMYFSACCICPSQLVSKRRACLWMLLFHLLSFLLQWLLIPSLIPEFF